MTPEKLLQKYHEILSTPIDDTMCLSGECVSMLYCSDWVKMMVVRSEDATIGHSIEVEVSFPACVIELNSHSSNSKQNEAQQFIDHTIIHLKYLLGLQSLGFTIGIISMEGIWSAILEIREQPDDSLFKKISPPIVK